MSANLCLPKHNRATGVLFPFVICLQAYLTKNIEWNRLLDSTHPIPYTQNWSRFQKFLGSNSPGGLIVTFPLRQFIYLGSFETPHLRAVIGPEERLSSKIPSLAVCDWLAERLQQTNARRTVSQLEWNRGSRAVRVFKVEAFIVPGLGFQQTDLLYNLSHGELKVCAVYRMLVFPVFELLLFACTAGWARALSSHGRNVVSRYARSVSDNQLEVFGTTNIPNHLSEKLSLVTSEDSSRTNMVTTTVAPLPQTTAPTVQTSTKLNISLTTTVTSTPSYPQNITTSITTTDFTTTNITALDVTTKKGNFYQN